MSRPGVFDCANRFYDARLVLQWSQIVCSVTSAGSYSYDTGDDTNVTGELSGSSSMTLNRSGVVYRHALPPTDEGQEMGADDKDFKTYKKHCGCPQLLLNLQASEPTALSEGELTVEVVTTPPPPEEGEPEPPTTQTATSKANFTFTIITDDNVACKLGKALLAFFQWVAPEGNFPTLSPPLFGGHVAQLDPEDYPAFDFAGGGSFSETVTEDIFSLVDPELICGTQSTTLTITIT